MTTRIVDQPLRIARGPVDGLVLEQSLQTLRKDILRHLFTYIGDEGRARSQKLLPMVNAGGKLSTQTAQPLTASDAGSDASIAIASHSVQFGSGVGLVAYNSGTITGLAFSTTYYVYTDDPTYSGGAVTYLATTNANTATANDGRYYVGKVTTPANGAGDTGGGYGGGGGGSGFPLP